MKKKKEEKYFAFFGNSSRHRKMVRSKAQCKREERSRVCSVSFTVAF